MRHLMKKDTLDRKIGPRRALVSGLAASLVLYEKITTTKAKAAAARALTERLISKAKQNTLAARRLILAAVPGENVAKKIMEVLGPRYADRKGGCTRVTMLRNRKGDGAEEVLLELL